MTRHLATLYGAKRHTYRSLLVRGPHNNISRLGLLCKFTLRNHSLHGETNISHVPHRNIPRVGCMEEPNRVSEENRTSTGDRGQPGHGEPREGVCLEYSSPAAALLSVRLASRDGFVWATSPLTRELWLFASESSPGFRSDRFCRVTHCHSSFGTVATP